MGTPPHLKNQKFENRASSCLKLAKVGKKMEIVLYPSYFKSKNNDKPSEKLKKIDIHFVNLHGPMYRNDPIRSTFLF